MDDFTQRMVERARQRAENLDKMCADTSPVRKRRSDENQTSNFVAEEEVSRGRVQRLSQIYGDSSNKRLRLRQAENAMKPDTPAIPSVKSRMAYISEDSSVVASPRSSRYFTDENEPPVLSFNSSSRKSRLAALTASINSWEDESSLSPRIHSTKREDLDHLEVIKSHGRNGSTKKGFFSPVGIDAERNRSPHKYTSEDSPRHYRSRSVSPVKQPSPSKYSPVPHQFVSVQSSDTSPAVSKLTVNLGSSKQQASPAKTASPYKSPANTASPYKSPANTASPYQSLASSPYSSPVGSPVVAVQVTSTKKTVRIQSDDEPTTTPISARLSKWQQKTSSETPAEKNFNPTPRTTPIVGKSVLRTPATANRVDIIRQPVNLDESMVEVTNTPVTNRKSLWEDKIAKSNQEVTEATGYVPGPPKPPRSTQLFKDTLTSQAKKFKTRRESMDKAPITGQVSPIKSPLKVGQGTRSIHERLTDMKASWEKNEIATSIKEKRLLELEALQNRWKDGVLREEDFRQQAEDICASVDEPISEKTTSTPVQCTPTAGGSRGKSARRDVAKEKARNDFESKLQSMGFSVSSSPAIGHMVTADIKSSGSKSKSTVSKTGAGASAKAVAVEEKKITTTSFGDNKVTVKAHTKEIPEHLVSCRVAMEMDDGERVVAMGSHRAVGETPSPVTKEEEGHKTSTYSTTLTVKPGGGAPQTPSTPGSKSIYNILKKQTPGFKTPGASDNFKVPITPSQRGAQRYVAEDSFESDDSFGETRIEYHQETTDTDTDYVTTTTLSSDTDSSARRPVQQYGDHRGSVSSTQSEDYTEYSDSQTEDYTDDYTESAVSDSEYTDAGGVDELLDEVLDTETESERCAPVAAPRQGKHKQVVFRNKEDSIMRFSDSSDEERRGRLLEHQKNRTTWAEGMISSETEDDSPLVYSLQMYRSTRDRSNRPPPQQTIVRPTTMYNPAPQNDDVQYLHRDTVEKRILDLDDLVHQEQTKIMQTSNALNQCCGADSAFASSPEAVECHKILLIACKKRECYLNEIQRLRGGRVVDERTVPQGSLTISDIRLPLRQEFVTKLGTPNDMYEHYFICLIRHNGHVIHTEMVSTRDAIIHGSLEFPNLIKLTSIQEDFKLNLEIYGMHINIQRPTQTPKKKKGTPKKAQKLAVQSPGGPMAIRTSSFTLMSALSLSMNCIHKTHFSLEKMPYQAPLLGTVHLRLTCLLESSISERGFLTMFEDVSGFGSWHRRWVVLSDGKLKYWKYPDEEKTKEPMGSIDLKQCISDVIGLIPRDVCARPNSFEIVSVRRQKQGEEDSLVKRCYNTMATTRYWLSADTRDERVMWTDQINESLRNLRAWHQDAMRPLKKPQH